MAFPAASVSDVYGVYFFGSWHAQLVVTTFKYRMSAIVGTPAVDAVYNDIFGLLTQVNKLQDTFLACCPILYTLNSIGVQRLTPTRVVRGGGLTPGKVGTNVNGSNTANLATFINRRTTDGTRRGHGGIHVPYPNLLGFAGDGTIQPTYKALLDSLGAAMLETRIGVSGTYVPVIMKAGGTIQDAKDVQFVQTMPFIRTMRTRTVGHGK